jgi:hypothetical protein
MNERQKKALAELLSLRRLTHETGTVTRRAQNVVVQALPPSELIAVSKALSDHQEQAGW